MQFTSWSDKVTDWDYKTMTKNSSTFGENIYLVKTIDTTLMSVH